MLKFIFLFYYCGGGSIAIYYTYLNEEKDMKKVTAYYEPAHFNPTAYCNIPAYWSPCVSSLVGNCEVWPCDSEADAIALGEEMIKQGLAA